MDFKKILEEKKEIIDAALEKYLPEGSAYPDILNQAMRYSLFAGGKRIRPVLCLEACALMGGDEKKALPCACALELIHTYSLIHDDLPCMDNDDFRRGRPTCHKVYGEATALLAGDALLTHAFYMIAQVPREQGLKVVSEISDLAGPGGLVGGQIADLNNDIMSNREQLLLYIHLNKTAKMIIASVRSGAIIAGAGKSDLMNLTVFAENLGVAFQIADDILDVTGTKEELGKSPGKDAEQKKLTFPALYGLEKSRDMLKQRIDKAIACLKIYGKKALFLAELTQYIGERKS
jgi:geranylgeranyl diphosphate synthase, type II